MFYNAEHIEKVLNCTICKNRMKDPRLLPCGKSVCNLCLTMTGTKLTNLNCQSCGKVHEIPHDGLPLNQIARHILALQPQEVYIESKDLHELKSISEDLIEKKKKISSVLEGDSFFLFVSCNFKVKMSVLGGNELL
jgi:hypothetical protein